MNEYPDFMTWLRKKHKFTSALEVFEFSFWRTSQYDDYDDALTFGAVYYGGTCYGYTTYADAMVAVRAALECVGGELESFMIHLTVDGEVLGDFLITDSY